MRKINKFVCAVTALAMMSTSMTAVSAAADESAAYDNTAAEVMQDNSVSTEESISEETSGSETDLSEISEEESNTDVEAENVENDTAESEVEVVAVEETEVGASNSITGAEYSTIADQSYLGIEITPLFNVRLNNKLLLKGRDYSVVYKNNTATGNATATVTGKGNYTGSVTLNFVIRTRASSTVRKANIIGRQLNPYAAVVSWVPDFTVNGSEVMYAYSSDFANSKTITVSGYGVNTAAIDTLKGDSVNGYDNSRNLYVKVRSFIYVNGKKTYGSWSDTSRIKGDESLLVPGNVKVSGSYSSTGTSIKFSWNAAVNNPDAYRIYRKVSGKWKRIAEIDASQTSYTDKNLSSATEYTYTVRAVRYVGDKENLSPEYYSYNMKTATVAVGALTVSATKDYVKLEWAKTKADGYGVFVYDSWYATWTNVGTTTGGSYKVNAEYVPYYGQWGSYSFCVKAYTTDSNGKKVYSAASPVIDGNLCGAADGTLKKATLSPHSSYKTVNVQGKKEEEFQTITLSENDKTILKNFASKYFTSTMTAEEKVETTLEWINKNVKYASATNDWNTIVAKSYIDAIFNYRLGQCAQYNGALVGMMAYLGYDVRLVMGYRGTPTNHWQHFWGEVKVGGKTYVMETGNYGQDGNWSFMCVPYSQAGGYMLLGKVAV